MVCVIPLPSGGAPNLIPICGAQVESPVGGETGARVAIGAVKGGEVGADPVY
jgi:hypothetical protein